MEQNKSAHILNTSSNLLGLCFIVLTALKLQNLTEASIIDEWTAFVAILFMLSCILSFISIRNISARASFYERIAEYLFMSGLIVMFLIIILISINIVF
ncbi:MAG: hypothetical protein WAS55_08880 [Saprospiraceae bacterium]